MFAAFEGLARLTDVALASLSIPLLGQDTAARTGISSQAEPAQATG
jgi:hypothetical protein